MLSPDSFRLQSSGYLVVVMCQLARGCGPSLGGTSLKKNLDIFQLIFHVKLSYLCTVLYVIMRSNCVESRLVWRVAEVSNIT